MADTIRTLSALQSLLADNTAGDISPQDVRDMLVSTYLLDYSADVSITGAATATIGKWHVCTGTSADYTVTLPAASGNAGKIIGLRMSSALTKLVTIEGNSSELIDGATTRVMWANEVAILFCDGTGWTKIGGKSIPMQCTMSRAASQNVGNSSYSKVTLTTTNIDNTGLLADPTTNNRINIKRTSSYFARVFLRFDRSGSAFPTVAGFFVNGAEAFRASDYSTNDSVSDSSSVVSLSVGDYVELYAFQASGITLDIYAVALAPKLSISEQITW
jgi:hypothetical protein